MMLHMAGNVCKCKCALFGRDAAEHGLVVKSKRKGFLPAV